LSVDCIVENLTSLIGNSLSVDYIVENLTSLIEAAKENGVEFVYALSPGLDITFSSAKDVQFLKRKLEQVNNQ
jgi:hypothetical protein